MLKQLKAARTAAAEAAATLDPGDPAVAFPAFMQEFFGGVEAIIPSLPSAPPEPELQAPQAVSDSNNAAPQPTLALQPTKYHKRIKGFL